MNPYHRYVQQAPVNVRKFSGDVVSDFLTILPRPADGFGLEIVSDANKSISAEGMAVLSDFRRYIFPDDDNIFHQESNVLLNLILKIESEVEPGYFTKPKLLPNVEELLNRRTPEVEEIEEWFGVSLTEKTDHGPQGDFGWDDFDQEVSSIISWDDEKKSVLANKILMRLLSR